MLRVRLEPELEQRLDRLARETGRSKSYYARQAILQFIEDREDYVLAVAAKERNEETVMQEELELRFGLAN
jgi:RHH-type rel operon transcriptional repressor/antitoxin RelB